MRPESVLPPGCDQVSSEQKKSLSGPLIFQSLLPRLTPHPETEVTQVLIWDRTKWRHNYKAEYLSVAQRVPGSILWKIKNEKSTMTAMELFQCPIESIEGTFETNTQRSNSK